MYMIPLVFYLPSCADESLANYYFVDIDVNTNHGDPSVLSMELLQVKQKTYSLIEDFCTGRAKICCLQNRLGRNSQGIYEPNY